MPRVTVRSRFLKWQETKSKVILDILTIPSFFSEHVKLIQNLYIRKNYYQTALNSQGPEKDILCDKVPIMMFCGEIIYFWVFRFHFFFSLAIHQSPGFLATHIITMSYMALKSL